VRRNLEPLTAHLARDFIVHTDEMVLDLFEQRAVAFTGPGRNPPFSCTPYPPYRIVASAPATRTLQPCRSLLRLFIEKVSFVHLVRLQQWAVNSRR